MPVHGGLPTSAQPGPLWARHAQVGTSRTARCKSLASRGPERTSEEQGQDEDSLRVVMHGWCCPAALQRAPHALC